MSDDDVDDKVKKVDSDSDDDNDNNNDNDDGDNNNNNTGNLADDNDDNNRMNEDRPQQNERQQTGTLIGGFEKRFFVFCFINHDFCFWFDSPFFFLFLFVAK